jgi:hypothetical protein
VNLFIAGQGLAPIDVERPRQALAELLLELPFFSGDAIETWRAPTGHFALCSVTTAPSGSARAEYACFEEGRAAMFSGRPVRWSAGGRADGRLAVDPRSYLDAREGWAAELDGRCTVIRAGEDFLEIYTDPLGAYPVFEARTTGARWFSNNADALRRLCGEAALDEAALASVLAGGWSLRGDPIWRSVHRLERGTLLRIDVRGVQRRQELLPVGRIAGMAGGALDPGAAAATLVELTAALADWPGRPNVVPVTGGRDSRLILAAALTAGVDFDARTGGGPGEPDVEIASGLCALLGIGHGPLAADPHGDRFSDLRRAARITLLASGGTATLADAAGFPLGARDGPPPLWHSGQGGEIARSYYGAGARGVQERLYRRFAGSRPGRTEPVSTEAAQLLRGRIASFVQEMTDSGASLADVPDLFYLLERMGSWAAASQGVVELVRDTTSPLWSTRLLPHLLALPARERELEQFHRLVLTELDPRLVAPRFDDGSTWPERRYPMQRRVQRARRLVGKVAAELRRRSAARPRVAAARDTPAAAAPPDPFANVLALVREAALSQPQHAAWSVLDRPRVERLLGSAPVLLDEMSRYYVWRLASVFLGMG